VLADTVGDLLPSQARALFSEVIDGAGKDAVLVSHMHNDLGLGLANTLAVLECGVRVTSSSWLGMAERSGMVATEQLLFLLAYHRERTAQILGSDCEPWWTPPDLTRLPRIAQLVSTETGVLLTVTTPIVGTGVGTISTGAPFTHPQTFQPFDPQQLLGIEPRVVLTHRLGYSLDQQQTQTALAWVKERAYRLNQATITDTDFAAFLDGLTAVSHRTGANTDART
jgi:2-isopropylmalate synthase